MNMASMVFDVLFQEKRVVSGHNCRSTRAKSLSWFACIHDFEPNPIMAKASETVRRITRRIIGIMRPVTVFASNQLNTPACSFFKQTMSILFKTTHYMSFLRDLEVPDCL